MEKISHNGSFSTKTDFRLKDGSQVRLEVWFQTECTYANRLTVYACNVSTKGKGCRKWIFQFQSDNSKDRRILQFVSEEQLYTAYYNHWSKLNPVRMFANGSLNGELLNISVTEKRQPIRHYNY